MHIQHTYSSLIFSSNNLGAIDRAVSIWSKSPIISWLIGPTHRATLTYIRINQCRYTNCALVHMDSF